MPVHIYPDGCPLTTRVVCSCDSISSLAPDHVAAFAGSLLDTADCPTNTDSCPSVIYLPANLQRPINEREFRTYMKVHQLEVPLDPDGDAKRTIPLDMSALESKWQVNVEQRRPAPRWPAICSICNAEGLKGRSPLLCCYDCGLSTHSSCRGDTVRPDLLVHPIYLCASCTFCNHCYRKDNQELIRTCDTCTGTWHVYCMMLPESKVIALSQQASTSFRCRRCSDLTGRLGRAQKTYKVPKASTDVAPVQPPEEPILTSSNEEDTSSIDENLTSELA